LSKPDTKLDREHATLGDLYRAIDWSRVNDAAMMTQSDPAFEPDSGFQRRWRLVLLEQALTGEEEYKNTARTLLNSAGVWEQVKALLGA
jgi:hypothetical protein